MKELKFLLIMIVSCCSSSLLAQQKYAEWLFDDFSEALVVSRTGAQYAVELNYSLLDNCFYFKDAFDNNELKRFAATAQVAKVKVGERLFVVAKNDKVQEVLQAEPSILLAYKGKTKAPKKGGYGGSTETAAVETRSTLSSGGQIYHLEGDTRIVYGIDRMYEIVVNNKKRTCSSLAQLLKVYSHQESELKAYMKDNKVDFNNAEDVVRLINYANSL